MRWRASGTGPLLVALRHQVRTSLQRGLLLALILIAIAPHPAAAQPFSPWMQAALLVPDIYRKMILHLPERYHPAGATVRLALSTDASVNATMSSPHGVPTLTIYPAMIDVVARLSYLIAAAEQGYHADLLAMLLQSRRQYPGGGIILELPSEAEQRMQAPGFHARWEMCLRSTLTQVMGHEVGHYILGHEHSLNSNQGEIDHLAVFMSNIQSQQNELEADRFGIYAVGWTGLDYRAPIAFWKFMAVSENRTGWRYQSDHPRSAMRARTMATIVRALGR